MEAETAMRAVMATDAVCAMEIMYAPSESLGSCESILNVLCNDVQCTLATGASHQMRPVYV